MRVGDRIVTVNGQWMTPIRLPLVGWNVPKYLLQSGPRRRDVPDAIDLPIGTEIVIQRIVDLAFVPSVDVGGAKSLNGSSELVGRIMSGPRKGDVLIVASGPAR
jgi:hypothetical protein